MWKIVVKDLGHNTCCKHDCCCSIPSDVQQYYRHLHQDKHYSQMSLLAGLLAIPVTIGKPFCVQLLAATKCDAAILFGKSADCITPHCFRQQLNVEVLQIVHADLLPQRLTPLLATFGCLEG